MKTITVDDERKVRITDKAYEHLQKLVDALNNAGHVVTMKGVASALILSQPVPDEPKKDLPNKKAAKRSK